MRDKLLPYGHQWIDEDDIKAVVETLKSDYLTTGSKVKEFEDKLANYCGAKYAVAVSSGTAALHCACYAAGLRHLDEVITTPITFFATIASILFCRARPVLVDVEESTHNISTSEIRKHITGNTKAIIPVDFAGHPVDIDVINRIAKENNLIVIEDACHALGAEYKGRKIGGLSDMTVFSFHPVKSVTCGEGGAIITNNKDYYEKLLAFRNHNIKRGQKYWQYDIEQYAYNYRLTDIQCSLGISQMNRLDYFIKRRHQIAKMYDEVFDNVDEIIKPIELVDVKSAHHLYVIQLKTLDREKVIQELFNRNIGAQVHYIPAHLLSVMKDYGYKMGSFPNAEKYYKRCLSLPIFPAMKDEDVNYVIENVKDVVNA